MAIDKKDLAEFKKLIAGGATLEDLTTTWAEAEAEIRREKRKEEAKNETRKELANVIMNYLELLDIITPEVSDEEYDITRDSIIESLKEWEKWFPSLSSIKVKNINKKDLDKMLKYFW